MKALGAADPAALVRRRRPGARPGAARRRRAGSGSGCSTGPAARPASCTWSGPSSDPSIPWTALVVGLWIPNFFYWGLNQYITQRTLGSKSLGRGPARHRVRRLPQAAHPVHRRRSRASWPSTCSTRTCASWAPTGTGRCSRPSRGSEPLVFAFDGQFAARPRDRPGDARSQCGGARHGGGGGGRTGGDRVGQRPAGRLGGRPPGRAVSRG